MIKDKIPSIDRKTKAWIAVAIVVIAILISYWRYSAYHPSTDDAYVQANVVQMSAQVSGPVKIVHVKDLQQVKAGDPLFTIDPKPYELNVARAEAQLQMTAHKVDGAQDAVAGAAADLTLRKAQLELTKKNTQRILALVKQNRLSQADGDKATGDLRIAQANYNSASSRLKQIEQERGQLGNDNAQLKEARAKLEQAVLDLRHTTVTAPNDGTIANFSLRKGSAVIAGQPLFALVESNQWWIAANFKETELKHIRPGQPAKITIDMYPSLKLHGIVDDISSGSGAAFSLLPAENATGNWVKVTQRFMVKINITDTDMSLPLRIGSSSYVTINTRS